jgi:Legume lectin domain
MQMQQRCSVCGNELSSDEITKGICLNCSILLSRASSLSETAPLSKNVNSRPVWPYDEHSEYVPNPRKSPIDKVTGVIIGLLAVALAMVLAVGGTLVVLYKNGMLATQHSTPSPSPTATATQNPILAFDNGFTDSSFMQLDGSAAFNGSDLRLTNAGNQSASVYYKTPTYVGSFSTTFTYRATQITSSAMADGFTFIIQNSSPTALGKKGGDIGYTGIENSVAVTFGFYYYNGGYGYNQTALASGGTMPSSFTPLSVSLYSGDLLRMTINYDSNILTVTTSDTVTAVTASQSYTVNIPNIVGSSKAYVGFTGATGDIASYQDILTWHYQPN